MAAGDHLSIHIHTTGNAGSWHWQVAKIDSESSNQADGACPTPIVQRGGAGAFPTGRPNGRPIGIGEETLDWCPSRSSDAQVDLSIVSAMDCHTSMIDIIGETSSHFAHRFLGEDEIGVRVQELCAHYSPSRR